MQQDHSYERHLPHQIPADTPLFLTWNLKGAITREMSDQIEQEQQRLSRQPDRVGETLSARRMRENKILFKFRDRHLDNADRGPMHLKDPAAAQIVVESILFGVPERYSLYAFVVMGNHVHVLFTPRIELAKIMQGIKGFTSRKINLLQNETGRVFWQDESFDHWVRDEEELFRIIDYIENNPVAAKLCEKPEDWLWSSARMRAGWPRGQTFQRQICTSGFLA
jgi:REP element-mobilizing transposase RayT